MCVMGDALWVRYEPYDPESLHMFQFLLWLLHFPGYLSLFSISATVPRSHIYFFGTHSYTFVKELIPEPPGGAKC